MKVVASDDDLQTALEFLQAALVCDPRNAEARPLPALSPLPRSPALFRYISAHFRLQVKADLDLIKRVQKTRAEAPQLLEKQVRPSKSYKSRGTTAFRC